MNAKYGFNESLTCLTGKVLNRKYDLVIAIAFTGEARTMASEIVSSESSGVKKVRENCTSGKLQLGKGKTKLRVGSGGSRGNPAIAPIQFRYRLRPSSNEEIYVRYRKTY